MVNAGGGKHAYVRYEGGRNQISKCGSEFIILAIVHCIYDA